MARLPAAPPSVGGPRREAWAWAWAWASVDDLLAAEEIDVVHICTPNATHADLVGRALAAGKHVVCEKPLTTAVAESRRLRDLVGASGLIGTVPFVYRFHPMARELRARLAGARIHVVTGAYLQDWLSRPDDTDWRVESALGGPSRAFGDIGSHLADLVEFVTGDRITWLHALTSTVYDGRGGRPVDTEDLVVVLFRLQRGALGTLTVSQVAPGRKNALTVEIAATDESLRFEQEAPEQLWIGRRHGSELLLRGPRSDLARGGPAERGARRPSAGIPRRFRGLRGRHLHGDRRAGTRRTSDVHRRASFRRRRRCGTAVGAQRSTRGSRTATRFRVAEFDRSRLWQRMSTME